MSVSDLLDPIPAGGGTVTFPDLANWQQGRTLYGGASALIAYTAAVRSHPGLPPLRAAQIAFVAPSTPQIDLRTVIVREGRNVIQLRSELWCEGHCTLSAYWLFGTERKANAHHAAAPLAQLPAPLEAAEDAMGGKGPAFLAANFEVRRAQDVRGPGDPVVRRWARLRDRSGLDPVSELILLGDVLPPGAMRAMRRQGPISSINWSFNLLETAPTTRDGWWLSENASQHADAGYSSERMRLWNADGKQVLEGMQLVAIFG